MKEIEVKILNPSVIKDAEEMMVAMARLTQRGHTIKCMSDLMNLLDKSYTDKTLETMVSLPHPTIQKFGVINIAVVGASRRFLAQITRHQNEVKFMSASLQYSDYTDSLKFVVPYEITTLDADPLGLYATDSNLTKWRTKAYLKSCEQAVAEYELAIKQGVPHDAAAYMLPQGMRNVVVISATPYQWKHMISQRTCNRNTLETQYVMLRCWEELVTLSHMFTACGPTCLHGKCKEGNMKCDRKPAYLNPMDILDDNFKYIRRF